MLFVADDDMQLGKPDPISNDIAHHMSSERLYNDVIGMRPYMDIRKTYLFNYGWNAQYGKPEASRAIVNEINSGVMFVNYFGHGSPDQWADERVLLPSDVPQMFNDKRYPLICSYSCGVGLFDTPGKVSLSEELVKAPNAGAGVTISASRSSGATSNETLARNFCTSLFDASCPSIGMALIRAKAQSLISGDGSNSITYLIMGDPSLRYFKPVRTVRLQVLVDSNGSMVVEPNTLKALQPVTVKGTIVDEKGNPDNTFGSLSAAYVQLGLYDAPEVTTRKDGGANNAITYVMPGKPVFSGKTPVRDGVFELSAVLPRSLSFDKTGPRLTAYAWENSKVGVGSQSYIFHGSVPPSDAMKNDTTGPRITIRPLYDIEAMRPTQASFSGTISSSLPLNCELALIDPSGIDISGTGPDEGLTMEIPGYVSRRNINQKFKFSEGDYRKGTAVLSFEENLLKTGATYPLTITAQDMLGNVAKVSFSLEIVPEKSYSLNHVFNTPNPVRMGQKTQFFFFPSTTTTQNTGEFGVVIKIYSLSGRLLRVIKNASNGEYWDCRDQMGVLLPPNIYLYQVTAYYPQDKKQVKSKIEKIVIHPPK